MARRTDTAATFTPPGDTAVVDDDFSRLLQPGEGGGWLARRDLIPLGYLGDKAKTARTYPMIGGVRWSIPGDRANMLSDGQIELLWRDSITINSGGEKIFVEEVERAVTAHPDDVVVVVVGRPSKRWGTEVVAIVQLAAGALTADHELVRIWKNVSPDTRCPRPSSSSTRSFGRRQGRPTTDGQGPSPRRVVPMPACQ